MVERALSNVGTEEGTLFQRSVSQLILVQSSRNKKLSVIEIYIYNLSPVTFFDLTHIYRVISCSTTTELPAVN